MGENSKLVTTVSNKQIKRYQTICIDGKYYEKNVDTFLVDKINGTKGYFIKTNPNLGHDYLNNRYVDIRLNPLIDFIIDFVKENNEIKTIYKKTYDTSNMYYWVEDNKKTPLYNFDTLLKLITFEKGVNLDEARNYMWVDYSNKKVYTYKSKFLCIDVISGCYIPINGSHRIVTSINPRVTGRTLSLDYSNCIYIKTDEGTIYYLNEQLANSDGYYEHMYDGVFKRETELNNKKGKKHHTDFCFDFKKFNLNTLKSRNTISEGKEYTFGVEIETSIGYFPTRLLYNLPFKCVRDGSLDETGGEYISHVLSRDYGFEVCNKMAEQLKKRCAVNEKCSIHVHIGNVPKTKEFNISLYHLGLKIQNEMLSMLPFSRTDPNYNPNYAIKKNYCKLLPVIEKDKNNLLKLINPKSKEEYKLTLCSLDMKINHFLLGCLNNDNTVIIPGKGWERTHNRKSRAHTTGTKWNRAARYYWLNLVNLNFDNKGTVEFRPHSGTTNSRKIINWIKICMGVCYYAEHNFKNCVNPMSVINLEEIIKFSYPKSYENILTYIEERKEKFSKIKETEHRAITEKNEYLIDE